MTILDDEVVSMKSEKVRQALQAGEDVRAWDAEQIIKWIFDQSHDTSRIGGRGFDIKSTTKKGKERKRG